MSEVKEAKNLYARAYQLEQELLTLKEDLKELKNEFLFNKEYNPGGLDKQVVQKTMKAAKHRAKQDNLKEAIERLEEIEKIIFDFEK